SRTTTRGSRRRSRKSPIATPAAASCRAWKAATTSARWCAASPRTCASSCDDATVAAVIRPFDQRQLSELVAELTRPGAVAELAILGGCLLAAWIVVRLVRGRERPVASVWFGNRIVDGFLFPVL